jgi:SAM-dependent methyltransferase
MAQTPLIFDRALVRQHLERAKAQGPAVFLLDRAADELAERLSAVTRRFPLALDLGTPGPQAALALARAAPIGAVLRAAASPLLLGFGPWHGLVADEEALPFAPGSLDLAVSLLSMQVLNDLPGTLLQLRQALRPDGLLLACLFGGRTLFELREAFAFAQAEMEGGISPHVAPFADLRDLGALLQRAGYALPVIDLDQVVVRYGDPLALLRDLRAMGATNPLIERRRFALRRATLIRAGEILAERFSDPDGRIRATFEIVWLSGWAPHGSQQRPLRPGSARSRLADALGVQEHSAGEKPG